MKNYNRCILFLILLLLARMSEFFECEAQKYQSGTVG